MQDPAPSILVISGPSGAGKSTLIKRALDTGRARLAVSATTRAPRSGEVDGRSYHFVQREDFLAMRERGELLEWAEVHGELYGTPRSEVLGPKDACVILDIDVQGFRSVQKSGLPFRSLFIAPPDLKTLEARLRARRTEDEARIERRLRAAEREMSAMQDYDVVIINDDLETAAEQLIAALPPGGLSP